jgi:hypothetical protein
VEAEPVIWTARLRTGRAVILRASVSRAFRAAALIASVAAGDLGVVALAALAVTAVEDFEAAADSEVDDEN